MGALIMAHGDDHGLVVPPKIAPLQVVIVPIYKKSEELDAISEVVEKIMNDLKKRGVSVKYDDSDKQRPGFKFTEYELKGIPVRMPIGPRDREKCTVEVARRAPRDKMPIRSKERRFG